MAKNSKKHGSQPSIAKEKESFKIPKKNRLLHGDSDDDELGQKPARIVHSANKFTCNANSSVDRIFKPEQLLAAEFHSLCNDFSRLCMYSVTQQTWGRHCSAWKLYNEFCNNFNVKNSLPISVEYARAFVTWAVTKKKLKSNTVKTYVSSLNVAHNLGKVARRNLNSDPCVKMVLKGAKNYSDFMLPVKKDRIPMSVDLLTILGHRLSRLNWTNFSKQVFWTACMTSFFSACRMGEILSPYEKNFDPSTTLLWENVKFCENNDILVLVPYSKTTGFQGKLLDLYPIESKALCPTAALKRLKKLSITDNIFADKKPGFTFKSGKFLTKAKMNKCLAEILKDFVSDSHKITGHSFRSAIPTALSSQPDCQTATVIQEWGGWVSSSFENYSKSERERRKYLFEEIKNYLFRDY